MLALRVGLLLAIGRLLALGRGLLLLGLGAWPLGALGGLLLALPGLRLLALARLCALRALTRRAELLAKADAVYRTARAAMDRQAIKGWLDAVFDLVSDANGYFAAEKPFDKALSVERKGTILYVTAEVVRQVAILTAAAMPSASATLLDLLAQPAGKRSFKALGKAGRLEAGLTLPAPVGVFPRYVDDAG